MKTSIFCYSLKGRDTALKIRDIIAKEYGAETECFAPERLENDVFRAIPKRSREFYGEHFDSKDLFVSVGSAGIAVRHIAPFVRSKVTDPAVIAVDELGEHVIPILSGHIGGANRMAAVIAEGLQGEAVITTATDLNKKFTVDEWASRNGMAISSMKTAKDFSAAILERDLPFKSDLPVTGQLPPGLIMGEEGALGLYVTWTKNSPFLKTLRIIPKCLCLGIGCRKGIEAEAVRQAVYKAAAENCLDLRSVKSIASIDLKKDEDGLLFFAKEMGITPEFFTAEELMGVEGDFTPSEFVKGITGVDNVCERAALKNADRLIVKKTALNGVTVAVAVKDTEVSFE